MERYDLEALKAELKKKLDKSLTEENNELVKDVKDLMTKYVSDPEDWRKEEKWSNETYTRTLLDSGNDHYNLMLLSWGPGQKSPIHNHPNSHCFMKTLKGDVYEELYRKPDMTASQGSCEMKKIGERKNYTVNDVALITDKDGVHRVGNESEANAVTLHLYSPPFQTCYKYDDNTSEATEVPMNFSD